MPVVHVDTEAAALIEAAVTMLEAALTARVERADPDKIISNSLILQSHKLESFRAQLHAGPPPTFSMMSEPLMRKALRAAKGLVDASDDGARNTNWELLRGLLNAAAIPPG